MSSKKITDADKLEIVDLYRQAGDTTASLAIRYGVSNSTISRILKTSIPEVEYEILIQQKRGSKAGGEEESLTTTDEPSVVVPTTVQTELEINYGTTHPESLAYFDSATAATLSASQYQQSLEQSNDPDASKFTEDNSVNRRVRRRSSAPLTADRDEPTKLAKPSPIVTDLDLLPDEISPKLSLPVDRDLDIAVINTPSKLIIPPPTPRTPILREIIADSEHRYSTPVDVPSPLDISTDEIEEDADDNTEDVNVLAAMFGEEIADGDDDDEFAEEDDEEESSSSYQQLDRNRLLTEDCLHVQVTPLSQATLPRTCYIVIDKFAELIVRPLKDFADLGQISSEEIQQRTLPIFDNHRVAKRFSNQRTQRVIKVPDSRVFHKTTQHLRSKGITRLLVDGNIYSLN
ncbi:transposase [Chamaesiphon sp. VAR_48_metabat_135_sub]|uniref:transposase n=1 Tax=Chamaesiphon sp. VAR_48_metabat_135_sub TaxID=2964699 RepID=UPI00286AD342|nr:transposase [Chamaesiphon sp. VAR_48_metabat_135_sub]